MWDLFLSIFEDDFAVGGALWAGIKKGKEITIVISRIFSEL